MCEGCDGLKPPAWEPIRPCEAFTPDSTKGLSPLAGSCTAVRDPFFFLFTPGNLLSAWSGQSITKFFCRQQTRFREELNLQKKEHQHGSVSTQNFFNSPFLSLFPASTMSIHMSSLSSYKLPAARESSSTGVVEALVAACNAAPKCCTLLPTTAALDFLTPCNFTTQVADLVTLKVNIWCPENHYPKM